MLRLIDSLEILKCPWIKTNIFPTLEQSIRLLSPLILNKLEQLHYSKWIKLSNKMAYSLRSLNYKPSRRHLIVKEKSIGSGWCLHSDNLWMNIGPVLLTKYSTQSILSTVDKFIIQNYVKICYITAKIFNASEFLEFKLQQKSK